MILCGLLAASPTSAQLRTVTKPDFEDPLLKGAILPPGSPGSFAVLHVPVRGRAAPVGAAVCPPGEIGVDWASTFRAAGASGGVLRFGELEGFFTASEPWGPAEPQPSRCAARDRASWRSASPRPWRA